MNLKQQLSNLMYLDEETPITSDELRDIGELALARIKDLEDTCIAVVAMLDADHIGTERWMEEIVEIMDSVELEIPDD